jgi:hypothetical protein
LFEPVVETPICEGSHTVTVKGTDRNAVVVVYHNDSVVARTRGTGGDAVIDLGDRTRFQFGDTIQVAQSVRDAIGPRSVVYVGCANVITQHNDNARSGNYRVETQLTPANVRRIYFGRLYSTQKVDGDIVAQPLYVRGVALAGGGKKNLFFIATSKNNVYAFDADNLEENASPIWHRNLCGSVKSGVCPETYSGYVGITSTPVIDPISNTMYVVARCSGDGRDGEIWIYALDIASGADRVTSVAIKASYRDVTFDFHCQRNRPGLLLQNGTVYVGFATFSCDSWCKKEDDTVPYHGWVIGYDASDLHQAAVFCTSPSNVSGRGEAGIWQTGNGLAGAPDGSIFFETGNGPHDERLQNSFVKLVLDGSRKLVQAGYFQPNNAKDKRTNALGEDHDGNRSLGDGDTDLGSGGPLLLPGGYLIGGGKQGRYYVLDQHSMKLSQNAAPDFSGYDGFQAFTNTYHSESSHEACVVAEGAAGCNPGVALHLDTRRRSSSLKLDPRCFIAPVRYGDGELCGPNIHGGPVFWQPDPSYGLIYQMPEKDFLKAFKYDLATHRVSQTPLVATGMDAIPPDGMPGGYSSISSNGARNGIVWTSLPQGDAQWNQVPGRLAAFDATTLKQIWSDDDNNVPFAKSVPPTIADGKVFRAIGGLSGSVIVYGLFPRPRSTTLQGPYGLRSSIQKKYESSPESVGVPASDERPVGDAAGGRYQDFKKTVFGMASMVTSMKDNPGDPLPTCSVPIGRTMQVLSSIYWNPKTYAHVVQGEIRRLWLDLGGPTGKLGYPIDDETNTPDRRGRMSRFQNGEIWWYADKGPFVAHRGSVAPGKSQSKR